MANFALIAMVCCIFLMSYKHASMVTAAPMEGRSEVMQMQAEVDDHLAGAAEVRSFYHCSTVV